jgi:3-hydroxyacyl-CoA dehydrogenase/enoyl-CoA hydratase/3-hydroxybutyryl-CoA epimerase
MVAEAVRCLEDATLERPADGDVGAILGLGFPPHLGGPFRWLDTIGAPAAVDRLRKLAAAHGAVFAVPPLLEEIAGRGVGFEGLAAGDLSWARPAAPAIPE